MLGLSGKLASTEVPFPRSFLMPLNSALISSPPPPDFFFGAGGGGAEARSGFAFAGAEVLFALGVDLRFLERLGALDAFFFSSFAATCLSHCG